MRVWILLLCALSPVCWADAGSVGGCWLHYAGVPSSGVFTDVLRVQQFSGDDHANWKVWAAQFAAFNEKRRFSLDLQAHSFPHSPHGKTTFGAQESVPGIVLGELYFKAPVGGIQSQALHDFVRLNRSQRRYRPHAPMVAQQQGPRNETAGCGAKRKTSCR